MPVDHSQLSRIEQFSCWTDSILAKTSSWNHAPGIWKKILGRVVIAVAIPLTLTISALAHLILGTLKIPFNLTIGALTNLILWIRHKELSPDCKLISSVYHIEAFVRHITLVPFFSLFGLLSPCETEYSYLGLHRTGLTHSAGEDEAEDPGTHCRASRVEQFSFGTKEILAKATAWSESSSVWEKIGARIVIATVTPLTLAISALAHLLLGIGKIPFNLTVGAITSFILWIKGEDLVRDFLLTSAFHELVLSVTYLRQAIFVPLLGVASPTEANNHFLGNFSPAPAPQLDHGDSPPPPPPPSDDDVTPLDEEDETTPTDETDQTPDKSSPGEQPTSPPKPSPELGDDSRNNLLASIRKGTSLRKVDPPVEKKLGPTASPIEPPPIMAALLNSPMLNQNYGEASPPSSPSPKRAPTPTRPKTFLAKEPPPVAGQKKNLTVAPPKGPLKRPSPSTSNIKSPPIAPKKASPPNERATPITPLPTSPQPYTPQEILSMNPIAVGRQILYVEKAQEELSQLVDNPDTPLSLSLVDGANDHGQVGTIVSAIANATSAQEKKRLIVTNLPLIETIHTQLNATLHAVGRTSSAKLLSLSTRPLPPPPTHAAPSVNPLQELDLDLQTLTAKEKKIFANILREKELGESSDGDDKLIGYFEEERAKLKQWLTSSPHKCASDTLKGSQRLLAEIIVAFKNALETTKSTVKGKK